LFLLPFFAAPGAKPDFVNDFNALRPTIKPRKLNDFNDLAVSIENLAGKVNVTTRLFWGDSARQRQWKCDRVK